jgi:hypothetical protein
MRTATLILSAVLLAPAAGQAQRWVEANDIVNHPFSTDFAAGGKLRLCVRSGEVRILGTAEPRISVEIDGWNAHDERTRKLKVKFRQTGPDGELRVSGGPKEDLTIIVRIPSETDLHAEIPFGEVEIDNVRGNHDVQLSAGELTMDVGNPDDYAYVKASVLAGELDAGPFDEYRGGLFRSFRKEGDGRYRLRVHVGAGELRLESRSRNKTASLN